MLKKLRLIGLSCLLALAGLPAFSAPAAPPSAASCVADGPYDDIDPIAMAVFGRTTQELIDGVQEGSLGLTVRAFLAGFGIYP